VDKDANFQPTKVHLNNFFIFLPARALENVSVMKSKGSVMKSKGCGSLHESQTWKVS
jgi:hypothetical protein